MCLHFFCMHTRTLLLSLICLLRATGGLLAQNPVQDSALVNESLNQAAYYLNVNPIADSALFFLQEMESRSQAMGWHARYIQSLNGQVQVYINEEDLFTAEEVGKRSIYEADSLLEADDPFLGQAYGNLGVLYAYLTNFEASSRYYQKALSYIDAESSELNDIATYIILNMNIGANAREGGDYYEAIRHYRFAQDLARANEQEDPFFLNQKLETQFEIGQLYWLLQEYEQSAETFEACLLAISQSSNKNPLIHLRSLHSYGRSLVDLQRYEEALKVAEKSIDLQAIFFHQSKRYFEGDRPFLTLARAYAGLNQAYQAEVHFLKSLRLLQQNESDNPNAGRLGTFWLKFGQFYEAERSWNRALSSYQKALVYFSYEFADSLGVSNPSLDDLHAGSPRLVEAMHGKVKAQFQLAQTSQNLEDWLEAYEGCQLLTQLIERERQLYRAEGSKLFLLQKAKPAYETCLSVLYALHQATNEPKYLESAFQVMEQSKAVLLSEAIQNSQARYAAKIPESLLQKEQSLRTEIRYLQDQRYRESQKPTPSETLLRSYRKEIFARKEAFNQLIGQYETAFPRYHELKYSRVKIGLTELLELLPANMQLIEYFFGEEEIYVFSAEDGRQQLLQISGVDSLQDYLGISLEQLHGEEAFDALWFDTGSRVLFQTLLAPVLSDKAERLIIIPDGRLGYLPFETLQTASPNAHPQGYLLHTHELQYGYSAQLLFAQTESKIESSASSIKWLGYAPTFNGSDALPYNEQEVAAIKGLMEGESRLGALATAEDFLENASQAKALHLSLHAYPDDQNPLYSYLSFAEDSSARVYAYQVYDLALISDLTVLSACHTAYGPLAKGEGIMSISRAFREAGCPSIVTSLWRTDGSVASELLVDFYRFLQDGQSKSAALRSAKLEYLKSAAPNRRNPR